MGTPGASYADRPALPHVSVPTTYSGAELTPFFGMTDPTTRQKSGGGGPTVAPIAAIYDPELTLSTPAAGQRRDRHERARPLRRGGLVAVTHARGGGRRARRRRAPRRRAAAGGRRPGRPRRPHRRAGRRRCSPAGALPNATMGVHHGLSQLVGGRTGIPHGLANAVILPHAMTFNRDAVPDALAAIGRAIGAPDDPIGAVSALIVRLGLPTRLSECGVTDDDLDAVARLAAGNRNVRPTRDRSARPTRGRSSKRRPDPANRMIRPCWGIIVVPRTYLRLRARARAARPRSPRACRARTRWIALVHLNQLQVVGSHNSYHVLATQEERDLRRSVHRRRGGRPRVRPRPAARCSSPSRRCARSSSTSSTTRAAASTPTRSSAGDQRRPALARR